MLSQFFLLSPRGDTIVNRDFRGDVAKGTPEIFFRKVKLWSEEAPPVLDLNGITCIFIRRNMLYFVVTTKYNISANLAIDLLQRITSIIKDFCGILTEESIRRNFILVYEVLDEILDFGYPQSTHTELLKQRVFNEASMVEGGHHSLSSALPAFSTSTPKTLPSTASNRPVGHTSSDGGSGSQKSEIFVDVLERLAVILSSTGHLINSSIDGSIQIKSYIQGNPELKIALNEDIIVRSRNSEGSEFGAAIILEDCIFHSCINLQNFDKWKILSFIPPEGEFTLMSYRLIGDIRLPFRIIPMVEQISPTQLEIFVTIKADIAETSSAGNVKLSFALPKNTSFAVCEIYPDNTGQSADHIAGEGRIVWSMKRIQGGNEYTLRSRVTLNSVVSSSTMKELVSLNMEFEIPMYSASSMQIKYLRVVDPCKSVYPFRWVRYITNSSSYVCRFS